MSDIQRSWRLKLPLIFVAADLLWAYSALKVQSGLNAAATVSAINSSIWIFLHLPAAILGGLPFHDSAGTNTALAPAELILIGSLGILQTAIVSFGLGHILDKKRK